MKNATGEIRYGYAAAPAPAWAQAFAVELWTHVAPAGRAPPPHRLLPTPEPSIALERIRNANGDVADLRWVLCCPSHGLQTYAPRPGRELICVRLSPESAARTVGIAPRDHVDSPMIELPKPLRDVLEPLEPDAAGDAAWDLLPKMLRALRSTLDDAAPGLTTERAFGELVRQAPERARVAAFAAAHGVSERHLRRRFENAVGLTPKAYARIRRALAALTTADAHARPPWADIAAAFGFADQPHLIAECRALSGLTPAAVHRERRAESEFYNPAKSA